MAPNAVADGLWIAQIDDIVSEVFRLMLQQSCAAAHEASVSTMEISAKVTFSGEVEGLCVVAFPKAAAAKLVDAFLGSREGGWELTMIEDAVGELCNMIAGGWKSSLAYPGSACQISAPEISHNSENATLNMAEKPASAAMTLRRIYTFDQSAFEVILALA